MQWYIAKGQKLEETVPVVFTYYFDMPVNEAERQGNLLDLINIDVYTCDEEEDCRPEYPDESQSSPGTRDVAEMIANVVQTNAGNWSS
jgi:hypothetical protein